MNRSGHATRHFLRTRSRPAPANTGWTRTRGLGSTDCMALTQPAGVQPESKESLGNGGRSEAADHHTFVVVQREWNAWRTSMVTLADLKDIQWLHPAGAPRPLIHAYVDCSHFPASDLQHECDLNSAPHRLLVCVLKSHTAPYVFDELARRASERGGLHGNGYATASMAARCH